MLRSRTIWLAAILLGSGCVLTAGASSAHAQEKTEALFSKSDTLTADDEMDTMQKGSHRKVYKIKLMAGKAYRIDMNSKEFDCYLRLEDPAGKQVAFNDDADPSTLDSRIIYVAPKTGEYRVIATTFVPGAKGGYKLEMKAATEAEAAKGRLQARIDAFAQASPAEQKKMVDEAMKDFEKKGKDLDIQDAMFAVQLAMGLDETNIDFTRQSLRDLIKVFDGAADKKVASLSPFLQQNLKKLESIGTPIDISGKTTDGTDFNLKNLKGKVVLVDFWATWCPPCVAEIPNIVEAHKKYGSKGFEIIGVSLDKQDSDITKFVDERKLPWKSIGVDDSKKLANKYGVNAIPHPILVGADGRIVSMNARGPRLEALLERLLGEKQK